MELTSTIRTAFCLGFLDGRKSKRNTSRRAVERKFYGLPSDAIEAYINGHDDGVKNDRTQYVELIGSAK